MKTYLLAISLISLFLISFTSCEDEMGKGGTGGGGKEDAAEFAISTDRDTIKESTDSLSFRQTLGY